MIQISVCMIVKNEEKTLVRCLDSLKGIWDELIIVDTGSTDRTKEIAARYTDKVYDFTWTGNFSDARNYSFSLAGCEYIYTADADEELDPENRKKFLQLKETLLPEIEIVQMYYGNQMAQNSVYNFDKEYRPKLYKRLRTFTWQGAVHEAVSLEPVVYDSDIEILHKPEGKHSDRDLQIFETLLAKGEALNTRLENMYLRELYFAGRPENYAKAESYLQGILNEAEPEDDRFQKATALLCRMYRTKQEMKNFLKYGLKGAATKGSSELCLELGEYFLEQKDYEEAAVWFYNSAYETECLLDIKSGGITPLKKLITCYDALGNKEQADLYLAELEKYV